MKTVNFYFVVSIILIYLISSVKGIANDDDYMIFVTHSYTDKNNDEYKKFISSVVEEIHNLIVQNKNTYQNPSILDRKKEEFDVNKEFNIATYGNSPYIYPISMIKYETVLYAYLSNDVAQKVKALPNIKSIKSNSPFSYDDDNSNNNNTPVPSNSNNNCLAEALGYSCCSSDNTTVYYTDENGDWGFDSNKNDWCGITRSNQYNTCFSINLGYPCCNDCEVVYTDQDGNWGFENNNWCGIKANC